MLLAVIAFTGACAKPDTAAAYRDEAIALELYYRPILDTFMHRIDRIRERGQALREPVPGAEATGAQLKAAFQRIGELHVLIADGNSALDKRIAAAGDDADALAKLVAETRAKLDAGAKQITNKLNTIETW